MASWSSLWLILTGIILQGLFSARNTDYDTQGWQGTLFVFEIVVVIYIANA
jgi:hypothetical protein